MKKVREELNQLDEKLIGNNYFNSFSCNSYHRCEQLDIAFNRFYDLYYIVAAANLNLNNANNKNLNLGDIKTNDEDLIRIFLRSEYLKNCIISYSCIEDYIMQILAVCLNLQIEVGNKKKIYVSTKNKKQFKRDIKKITYKNVSEALKYEKYEKEYEIVHKYHSDINRIKNLANQFKHNANIRFKELPRPSYVEFQKENRNGECIYRSIDIEQDSESLDEVIDLCYNLNPIIKKYVEDIYDIVDEKYNLKVLN